MNQRLWYTARAGGIVAWVLLATSVVWGLWLSGRVRPFGVRPAWVLVALPLYLLATVHLVSVGTDASNPISLTAIGIATSSMALLVHRRMRPAVNSVASGGGGRQECSDAQCVAT